MAVNLDIFWLTVLIALAVGFVVLFVIMRADLVPVGAQSSFLDGGGRLFLGTALGIGIVSFILKLIVVLVLTTFPEQTINPLLEGDTNLGFAAKSKPVDVYKEPVPRKVWLPLPESPPSPSHNPITDAKVQLGQRLFNDVNLSKDRTVSCASCHDLNKYAGADGRAVAVGVGMAEGGRNTPTVLNAAYQTHLFWDGRARSLEAQTLGPLLNPIEMAMPSRESVVARVRADLSYEDDFQDAFGVKGSITIQNIAKAIAAYERTLVTHDAPIDRFLTGDESALSDRQKRGMYLFRKLGCSGCHAGPNFSGASKVGGRRPFAHLRTDRLSADDAQKLSTDKGRSQPSSEFGLWRIPSLRNVALTGPYLHNGSIKTLREAVTIMLKAQINADIVNAKDAASLGALHWDARRNRFNVTSTKRVTEDDISDIVQFLHALSSVQYSNKQKKIQSVSQDTETAATAP